MKNFYYEGTRFKNGNCNIRFSPDEIADIKRGKFSDIETLSFKMDRLDLCFFGEQFCISNFEMGVHIYSAYSGKLFSLNYSDIDSRLMAGKTLKLIAFKPDAETQKSLTGGIFEMFTLNKYRLYDCIQIKGMDADVYEENENGELIDPMFTKDFSYFKAVSTIGDDLTVLHENEWVSAQNWFLSVMSDNFYFAKAPKISYFSICGDRIQFWTRENANGDDDTNGKYFVLRTMTIEINRVTVEENDLRFLFPGMEW